MKRDVKPTQQQHLTYMTVLDKTETYDNLETLSDDYTDWALEVTE
jgi:hypothetical protein